MERGGGEGEGEGETPDYLMTSKKSFQKNYLLLAFN
jgi:hypothetical protein